MTKAVAYIRVSTTEQAIEGYSLNAQLSSITEYVKRKGWNLVRVYADEGISASTIKKRNGLLSLMQDAEKGLFDKVIILKVDRISRRTKDAMLILNHMEKHDVGLESIRENFDLTSTSGKAMFQILSSFAELERNKLSENVKTGMKQKAKEGGFLGGIVYGYDIVDGKLVPNSFEEKVVKLIFLLRSTGYSYNEITVFLNGRGLLTKKGNRFTSASIKGILTNVTYTGCLSTNHQKEIINRSHTHEAIISTQLFKRTQEIDIAIERSSKHGFWLTNLLDCPQCGGDMVRGTVNNKGKLHHYYLCKEARKCNGCSSNSVRKEEAETIANDFLEDEIIRWLPNSSYEIQDSFRSLYDELMVEQQKKLQAQVNSLNNIQLLYATDNSNSHIAEKIEEMNRQISLLNDPFAECSTVRLLGHDIHYKTAHLLMILFTSKLEVVMKSTTKRTVRLHPKKELSDEEASLLDFLLGTFDLFPTEQIAVVN